LSAFIIAGSRWLTSLPSVFHCIDTQERVVLVTQLFSLIVVLFVAQALAIREAMRRSMIAKKEQKGPIASPPLILKTAHELYEEWCTFLREKTKAAVEWPSTPQSSKDNGEHAADALRMLRVR
jgi:hypothetical protein